MPDPEWLPDLVEYQNDWDTFVDTLYEFYLNDFVTNKTFYNDSRIGVRYHPETKGKGFGFWHCISEGSVEEERTPDFNRCSRIRWIKAIIDNSDDPTVDVWTNTRDGRTSHLLWFREEFLVILAERNGYYLLITAYVTDRNHRICKLREERDRFKNG